MRAHGLVKICGVKAIAAAHAARDAGADLIGFNFHPKSPRYIEPAAARAIIRELDLADRAVAVTVDLSPQRLWELVEATGARWVQLHGNEPLETLLAVKPHARVIRALRLRDASSLNALPFPEADLLLLDAYHPALEGGTGLRVDADLARRAMTLRPSLLAGGLTPDNVAAAIAEIAPLGVDTASGVETAPGVKSAELISAFVSTAKKAFAKQRQ